MYLEKDARYKVWTYAEEGDAEFIERKILEINISLDIRRETREGY